MSGPHVGGISTCPKCKSKIVATYKKLSLNNYLASMVGAVLLMLAVVLMVKHSGLRQQVVASLFILLWLAYSLFLSKVQTGRLFGNPWRVIEYDFYSGVSYEEEIKLRRELFYNWLDNAETDFVGFIRYLYDTEYIWESLDNESQDLLMDVYAQADTLPDQRQLTGYSGDRSRTDQERIDSLRIKYLPLVRPVLKKVKESTMDY